MKAEKTTVDIKKQYKKKKKCQVLMIKVTVIVE